VIEQNGRVVSRMDASTFNVFRENQRVESVGPRDIKLNTDSPFRVDLIFLGIIVVASIWCLRHRRMT
jgi:hypothetical protein